MIYNDSFVWLHFPKNAGTKIEQIFDKYFFLDNSIVRDDLSLGDGHWHDSIEERERRDSGFRLANRDVIVCVRRLPNWLVSRYNYEVARSPHLEHDPLKLLEGNFLEANGFQNHADYYIKKYVEGVPEKRLRFIRVENFKEDFLNVFGCYLDLSALPHEEISQRANVSKGYLTDDFLSVLDQNVDKIYENCPRWYELDKKIYDI